MLTVLLIYVANCIVTGSSENFSVRLNNSLNNNLKEGRLEIYYSGRWGTVCDDGFTDVSARVACASLGFGYIGTAIGNRYGAGTDPIWLDDVNCNGTERGLEQCAHPAWGAHNCGHQEDVSVSCDCGSRNFDKPTGTISSQNYPNAYGNNLDCYSFISVSQRHSVIITFQAFNTESSFDWVTITCASGTIFTERRFSGSQIPAALTISSCYSVKLYFHTDGFTTSTGFSLTYEITSDCANRYFNGTTGTISSQNFPMVYTNYLDCSNYISVPTGQTIIITFLAFNTQPTYDWVTITCESGSVFRSPRYSGYEFPAVLTISSCSRVNVYFHTEGYSPYTGFNLTYSITSDIVTGGITTKPSNAFPRTDTDDPIIFNCTTATKYLPWWTMNAQNSNNYTITNSTCGVITSLTSSSWFLTETLGPGSCNLIVVAPGKNRYLLAGSLVCTDSSLTSARAILVPINLELRLTRGLSSWAAVTDIIRDEEMRISCNPSFTDRYSNPSLVFTYILYSGGPFVRMRILRTYWTSQGKVISSNDTSNTSSYVLVNAPKDGEFPRYTCNIVCDFFSNISDISGRSSLEILFSTETIQVLYWPTEDNMTIIGHNSGQIRTPALLYCNVAANPPATYTWIDESNGIMTNGPTIVVNHGGRYACNASNIIRGQYYQQSKSVNLQVIEDDTDRLKLMAIILGALLGAAVLAIIILTAILLSRKCRQQKTNTDVGHINHGTEHELRQRGERNNRYEAGFGNTDEVVGTDYENLDVSKRPVSIYPDVYEELDNRK